MGGTSRRMRPEHDEKRRGAPRPGPAGGQTMADLFSANGRRQIDYVGSATSHFQAEPLLYDKQGNPRVSSDWEVELTRLLKGQHCRIPNAKTTLLPKFLARRDGYIRRSAELSENMFRFSLDFGRLCPREGEFDEGLMTEYIKTLVLIKLGGLCPFLTLHHFTSPKWLIQTDRDGNIVSGAWENRGVTRHFGFYVNQVVSRLADRDRIRAILQELKLDAKAQERILSEGACHYFMTLNEPAVLIPNAYLGGLFPPYQRGNLVAARRALNNLVEAHRIATDALKHGLKAQISQPQVGIGHNWQYFRGVIGRCAQAFQEYCTHRFEQEGPDTDFLGLHYYFRWKLRLTSGQKSLLDYSDYPQFGDIYPAGILEMIRRMHSQYPGKQLFISEFGFSDRRDRLRPYWILETARYVMSAVKSGIPIKGLLLWSLVDNFEWQSGTSQRFGLFSERELDAPLDSSQKGIRSWEVWRTLARSIASPSSENLESLQQSYNAAYEQYKEAGGRY